MPWGTGAIAALLNATTVTDSAGESVDLALATTSVVVDVRRAHEGGSKLIFVGVGADAGSASHMAIDFSKNGNVRALSFELPGLALANTIGTLLAIVHLFYWWAYLAVIREP